jgi:hypothetical protein
MKTLITVVLVSTAIPVVSQSTPQHPVQPKPFFQSPQQFQYFPPGSTKPQIFTFNGNLNSIPRPQIVLPPQAQQLANPHIDAQIIHRPPMADLTEQQPRTPLAGSLFPGLKILPLDSSRTETARLEPIPVYFPKAKVEPIPIASPNAEMTLIESATTTAPKK